MQFLFLVCTYRNRHESFKCEICDTRKGTSTRKPRLNPTVVQQQTLVQTIAVQQTLAAQLQKYDSYTQRQDKLIKYPHSAKNTRIGQNSSSQLISLRAQSSTIFLKLQFILLKVNKLFFTGTYLKRYFYVPCKLRKYSNGTLRSNISGLNFFQQQRYDTKY